MTVGNFDRKLFGIFGDAFKAVDIDIIVAKPLHFGKFHIYQSLGQRAEATHSLQMFAIVSNSGFNTARYALKNIIKADRYIRKKVSKADRHRHA